MFDEGRIVENGSFDELVALNGRFAQLARAQFMIANPYDPVVPAPLAVAPAETRKRAEATRPAARPPTRRLKKTV